MKPLSRAIDMPTAVGERIPLPWRGLDQTINLRTKDLVVIGGAPGGGKSTVAANLAVTVGVPVLYCAQDSPGSILSRMTAIALGEKTADIQRRLTNHMTRPATVEKMKNQNPTLIVSSGSVQVEQIRQMCLALHEWLGRTPPIIIIDNLIDLIVPGKTHHDLSFYSESLPELKRLALEMDSCVIALHHVTRGGATEHGRGQTPLTMNDLLYAGEREARHVWGVYNNGDSQITVQILKQQDGPASPGGGMRIPLRWYPEMGKLASEG